MEDYKIDERRQFEELQTDAINGLTALRKFFEKYKLFAAKSQFENALKTGWNQIIDLDSGDGPLRTIETLRADPVLKYRWQGPQRRPRPGHQPEPWLKEARRELSAQKVPKIIQEELLHIIGL